MIRRVIVRFTWPQDPEGVAYPFGDARAPARGERVWSSGQDLAFPAGCYRVMMVHWHIGVFGPDETVVTLAPASDW